MIVGHSLGGFFALYMSVRKYIFFDDIILLCPCLGLDVKVYRVLYDFVNSNVS
jgi:predicted alpha/beta superfamily hydrolase